MPSPLVVRVLSGPLLLLALSVAAPARSAPFGTAPLSPAPPGARWAVTTPERPPAFPTSVIPRMADDGKWWDGFAVPDVNGPVNAVVEFQGSLVIGGAFTRIGDLTVGGIARWDGARWSALGEGFNGTVLSLAVYGDELVASGWFTQSGSSTLKAIARWDGTRWNPLGAGLEHSGGYAEGAYSMAVSGGNLYVTGGFEASGSTTLDHVARWDGAAWFPLGAGVEAMGQSIFVTHDSVYVGGYFSHAGGVPARGVALWDGQAWSSLGSGVAGAYGYAYVLGLTRYRDMIVAVGYFDSAGSAPARNIAGWDGSSWHPFDDAANQGVYSGTGALAVQGDELTVGGWGLMVWNGASWNSPSVYANGWVGALARGSFGLALGGSFTGFGNAGEVAAVNVGLVENDQWIDLSALSERTHGLGGAYRPQVLALSAYRGTLVAAGRFDYGCSPTGRTALNGFGQWDGQGWSPLDKDFYYADARALETIDDVLYAAGFFPAYPLPSWTPMVRYDGAHWSPMDTLSVVALDLASFQGKLHLCGMGTIPGGRNSGIYRWDGQRWESLGSVHQSQLARSMAEYAGQLVVCGDFDSIDAVPAKGIASWDGASWHAMDAGLLDGGAWSLVVCGGVLYAAGQFHVSTSYVNVLRWEGDHWIPLSRDYTPINALACVQDDVYGAGSGQPSSIMRWDGGRWVLLGSGTDGPVTAIQGVGDFLYVGGWFTKAGGKSSSAIARWDLSAERRFQSVLAAKAGVPNPFTSSTSVALRLSAPGSVHVSVFDARGRRMAVLEDAYRPAGGWTVTWDGRTGEGETAPAGLYFIRISTPGRSETRKVVRIL